MSDQRSGIERIDAFLEGGEAFLVKILLGCQVAIIFSEIVFRYVLDSSLIWSEELARYLLVWVAMLGCSIALRKKGHFGIELLVKEFPKGIRKLCALLTCAVMFIFLGTMTAVGTLMVAQADEVSTVMQMPMRYPYAAIPLGGFLMLFHLFVLVRRDGLEKL
jgi:TRAP-type C4-dicarboxylate transport system permease small subunit